MDPGPMDTFARKILIKKSVHGFKIYSHPISCRLGIPELESKVMDTDTSQLARYRYGTMRILNIVENIVFLIQLYLAIFLYRKESSECTSKSMIPPLFFCFRKSIFIFFCSNLTSSPEKSL
jgi:hypothetical protein